MRRLNQPRRKGFQFGTRCLLAAALAVAAFGLVAAPAGAATVTVNTTVDQSLGSCSGTCSLRDAVATSAAGDTVVLPAGTYGLTLGPIQIDKDLIVAGAGARSTSVDGNATVPVFVIGSFSSQSPVVQISDLTVANGLAAGNGGGIENFATLTVTRCTITNNRAFNAAGILNDGGATLTIRESAIVGNHTTGNAGGGIGNAGALTLINTTLSGNVALRNGGASGGGGLYNIGDFFVNPPTATLTAVNSTIASNVADPANGGGMINIFAQITLINTILSGNTGGNCVAAFGVTQTTEYSLDSDGTCGLTGVGDLSGVDPLLGPLADNGGPTDTQALGAGSPAIDSGDSAAGVCPATDQRGVSRPQGPGCDMGAFEVVVTPQSQIAALIAQINALVAGGSLAQNNANPLITKLNHVVTKLNGGQTNAACGQLGAFINQLNADIGNGTLTAAQGQPLLAAANAIKASIGC